jgi:hypothetical protein
MSIAEVQWLALRLPARRLEKSISVLAVLRFSVVFKSLQARVGIFYTGHDRFFACYFQATNYSKLPNRSYIDFAVQKILYRDGGTC